MTRHEFMNELRQRLARLPNEERESALSYYEEYFDEAGLEREASVIRELVSPAVVASRILADYALKAARAAPLNPKKSISAIWFVLLAIVAAPIALPLVFAAVGGIIAVVASLFSVGVVAFFLVVGGVALFFTGIFGMLSMPASALLLFGAAFLLWGIGKIIFSILGVVFDLLGQFISYLFGRSKGGSYGR